MTGQGNFACLIFLYHFPAISVVEVYPFTLYASKTKGAHSNGKEDREGFKSPGNELSA